MAELSASYELIADTQNGPIVAVVFGGTYPPGSAGNEAGLQMVSFLRSTLASTGAAAVVVDLLALNYTWGDAIAGLGIPLLRDRGFRPAAVVATGPTAGALEPLLQPQFALGLASARLFGSRREAVAYLERVVALSGCFVKWGELDHLLRRLAKTHLRKPKHERGPMLSIVDGLVSSGLLPPSFRSRLDTLTTTRDQFVESASVPTEVQVRSMIQDLDSCLDIVNRSLSNADHNDGG